MLITWRDQIRSATLEMMALRKIIVKRKIFSDTQVIKGFLSELRYSNLDITVYEILNIKKQQSELIVSLHSDQICKRFIKKNLKKSDGMIKLPYIKYLS